MGGAGTGEHAPLAAAVPAADSAAASAPVVPTQVASPQQAVAQPRASALHTGGREVPEKLAKVVAGVRRDSKAWRSTAARALRCVKIAAGRGLSSLTNKTLLQLYAAFRVKAAARAGDAVELDGTCRTALQGIRVHSRANEVRKHRAMRAQLATASTLLRVRLGCREWPANRDLSSDDGTATRVSGQPDGSIVSDLLRELVKRRLLRVDYAALELKTEDTGKELVSWRQAMAQVLLLAKDNDWTGAVLLLTNVYSIVAVFEFLPATDGGDTKGTVVVHLPPASVRAQTRECDFKTEDQVKTFVTETRDSFKEAADYAQQLAFGLVTVHACFKRWHARLAPPTAPAPAAAGAASATRL